jgi:urease accessory protein UreF
MKFRKEATAETDTAREEVREMAEALRLYGSAMRHIAEREAARTPIAVRRPTRTMRFSLLLAPALATVVAAAVIAPVYSRLHQHSAVSGVVANTVRPGATDARANVDDTVLMNQIDSELSEDVPDALQPLADLSDLTTNASSVSEKKNVTKE